MVEAVQDIVHSVSQRGGRSILIDIFNSRIRVLATRFVWDILVALLRRGTLILWLFIDRDGMGGRDWRRARGGLGSLVSVIRAATAVGNVGAIVVVVGVVGCSALVVWLI